MDEYIRQLYDKYAKSVKFREENKMKSEKQKKTRKYTGRMAGIAVMLFIILVIIPAAAVMFVISGLWAALDRFLLKFER